MWRHHFSCFDGLWRLLDTPDLLRSARPRTVFEHRSVFHENAEHDCCGECDDKSDIQSPCAPSCPCSTPEEAVLLDSWCHDCSDGSVCCVCGGGIMGVVVWSPIGPVHHGCRTFASHMIFAEELRKELVVLRKMKTRDRRKAHLERFEATRARKAKDRQRANSGSTLVKPTDRDLVQQVCEQQSLWGWLCTWPQKFGFLVSRVGKCVADVQENSSRQLGKWHIFNVTSRKTLKRMRD